MFEVWTWAQLGFHDKPCALLNAGGYYDRLVDFLDHAWGEEFVSPVHREMLIVESDPQALLARFSAYQPPVLPKWVGQSET